ncbi:hypothetical protein Leryth_012062, partial [Lithospermum erythrorhizon]
MFDKYKMPLKKYMKLPLRYFVKHHEVASYIHFIAADLEKKKFISKTNNYNEASIEVF